MKSLKVASLLLVFVLANSCKKTNSPSVATMLQHKWTMLEYSVNYPTDPSDDEIYDGTGADYFQFLPNDTLYQYYGLPGVPGLNLLTTPYHLTNSNTFILYNAEEAYTILILTDSTLVLSNRQILNTTDGTRIITFKR